MRSMVRGATAALAAAALLAAPAAAQSWAVGVEGGVVRSDLEGEGAQDVAFERESGFRGAAVLRYTLSPGSAVAVQTGLGYARKGAAAEGTDLDLDYLDVPLLLVLNIPVFDEGPLQPRLFGGGVAAFEVGCQVGPAGGEAVPCAEADAVETAGTDLGVRFGGGLDVELRRDAALVLEVGYDLGLTDVDEAAGGSLENRSLHVTGGFLFAL